MKAMKAPRQLFSLIVLCIELVDLIPGTGKLCPTSRWDSVVVVRVAVQACRITLEKGSCTEGGHRTESKSAFLL
jgi:hypothetical protein